MHKDNIEKVLRSIPLFDNLKFEFQEMSLREMENNKSLRASGCYFNYHKDLVLYIGLAFGETMYSRNRTHIGKGTNFMHGNRSANPTKQWTWTYENFIAPTNLNWLDVNVIGITWDNPTKSQVAAVEGVLVEHFQPLINDDTFDKQRLLEAKQYV